LGAAAHVVIARKTAIAKTIAKTNATLCGLGAMISTSGAKFPGRFYGETAERSVKRVTV
jgi:hypothetical protein